MQRMLDRTYGCMLVLASYENAFVQREIYVCERNIVRVAREPPPAGSPFF